jgi:hypothetical protein
VSDPTPNVPPPPEPADVHAVAGPWWSRRGVLWNIVSFVTGFPALLSLLHAIPGLVLPSWLEMTLLVTAAIGNWLATQFNSIDAADSSARASRMGPGAGDGF